MSGISGTQGNTFVDPNQQPDTTMTTPTAEQNVGAQQVANSLSSLASVDPALIQQDLAALLARAGLERGVDGAVVVKDTTSIAKPNDVQGLNTAEKLYSSGDVKLKPPAPPKIQMTSELNQGAESFANNLDSVFNEFFMGPNAGTAAETGAAATNTVMAEPTMPLSTDGTGATDPASADPAAQSSIFAQVFGTNPTLATPGTPGAPGTQGTQATQGNALQNLQKLSADVLLALFLKLNINDPNNSVKTHQELIQMSTNMRQQAIKNAEKKQDVAHQQMEKARAYAAKARMFGTILTVVMLAITIALTVVTCGAAGLLVVAVAMAAGALISKAAGGSALEGASIGAAVGSMGASAIAGAAEAGAETAAKTAQETAKAAADSAEKAAEKAAKEALKKALQQAQRAVQAVGMIGKASADYEAQTKMDQAEETGLTAERAKKLAEEMQKNIENENQIMQMIMESKNQVVDNVLKMMQAMMATNTKLMSAGMAR